MMRALIVIACLVVILAGAKSASSLIVPFLLAAFLAILLAPPFIILKRRGIPSSIALVLMIATLTILGILTVTILKTSLDQFTASLPTYQANLRVQLETVWQWLEARGVEAPSEFVSEHLDPSIAMTYAGRLARALSGMLGQAFLIFIIVAFMLVEAGGLRQKAHAIPGTSPEALDRLERNLQDVRHYFSLKSVMSLLTGALVAVWLWVLEIDNALFMGLLAFFLNFIPAIGSLIASVPGILLGFIQLGPTMALVTAIGYIAINIGVSNVLEPRFMGQGLGLSPLVIVLSMILWGWLLGPVGMLLSVPLTMAVKVILENGTPAGLTALGHKPPKPQRT